MENDKQVSKEMERKVKKSLWTKNFQKRKLAQGLCIICAKNPINPQSKLRCSFCLDKAAASSRKYAIANGLNKGGVQKGGRKRVPR